MLQARSFAVSAAGEYYVVHAAKCMLVIGRRCWHLHWHLW